MSCPLHFSYQVNQLVDDNTTGLPLIDLINVIPPLPDLAKRVGGEDACTAYLRWLVETDNSPHALACLGDPVFLKKIPHATAFAQALSIYGERAVWFAQKLLTDENSPRIVKEMAASLLAEVLEPQDFFEYLLPLCKKTNDHPLLKTWRTLFWRKLRDLHKEDPTDPRYQKYFMASFDVLEKATFAMETCKDLVAFGFYDKPELTFSQKAQTIILTYLTDAKKGDLAAAVSFLTRVSDSVYQTYAPKIEKMLFAAKAKYYKTEEIEKTAEVKAFRRTKFLHSHLGDPVDLQQLAKTISSTKPPYDYLANIDKEQLKELFSKQLLNQNIVHADLLISQGLKPEFFNSQADAIRFFENIETQLKENDARTGTRFATASYWYQQGEPRLAASYLFKAIRGHRKANDCTGNSYLSEHIKLDYPEAQAIIKSEYQRAKEKKEINYQEAQMYWRLARRMNDYDFLQTLWREQNPLVGNVSGANYSEGIVPRDGKTDPRYFDFFMDLLENPQTVTEKESVKPMTNLCLELYKTLNCEKTLLPSQQQRLANFIRKTQKPQLPGRINARKVLLKLGINRETTKMAQEIFLRPGENRKLENDATEYLLKISHQRTRKRLAKKND